MDHPPKSGEKSPALGVRVFFPEFLVAQIRLALKLQPAAKLGVAPVLQLGDEQNEGSFFGGLRFGFQMEAFIPEDGLKRSVRDFHFDLSIKPPAQVIEPGNLIGIGRGDHVIDRVGVQRLRRTGLFQVIGNLFQSPVQCKPGEPQFLSG